MKQEDALGCTPRKEEAHVQDMSPSSTKGDDKPKIPTRRNSRKNPKQLQGNLKERPIQGKLAKTLGDTSPRE